MEKHHARFLSHGDEPLITDMINDPVVHLMMARDGVKETDLIEMIISAQRAFEAREQINYA